MFSEFFRFDVRYQLRSPLVWVAGFVFALMAFGATSSDAISIGGAVGNVHRNAPAVVVDFFSTFSVIGLFVVTAFIAQPLLRDFELGTDELFFATPMRPWAYLAGRLVAGVLASLLVFVLCGVGMQLGAAMPWIDPQRLGPFSLRPQLWSFAVIVIPNLLFSGALLSLLAVSTRRLLTVYLGVMGFFVLYMVAGFLTRGITHDLLGSLLDPFGARALEVTTRYWSASERNRLLPALTGFLLWNRVLWLSISVLVFGLTFKTFRPQRQRGRRSRIASDVAPPQLLALTPIVSAAAPSFGRRLAFAQLLHQLRFDTLGVLKSIPFVVLVVFGMINVLATSTVLEDRYGTSLLPVTAMMLKVIESGYTFLLILIVGFYAGELVHKERSAKLWELTDTLPVPDWVPMFAKIGALIAVVLVFMLMGVVTCLGIQLARGFAHPELLLYAQGVLIQAVPFVLTSVIAVVLHVVFNQKFAGYLAFVLLIVVQIALPALKLEHNLYRYAGASRTPYSDMNGFGHFIPGFLCFQAYWAVFTAILVVGSSTLWVRGTTPSLRARLRTASVKLRGTPALLMAALTLVLAILGGYIFYNTNIINEYQPSDLVLDRRAHYEKAYRRFKDTPQPRVVAVRTEVDIFPDQRRVNIHGHHTLVNPHPVAIRDLHLFLQPPARLESVTLAGATLVQHDPPVGYWLYRLPEPLQPGATIELDYTVVRAERGFTNDGMPPAASGGNLPSPLNANGTFFDSFEMLPHFGYSQQNQIIDRNERRKRGLFDVPRAAKLEDESARDSIGLADAAFITFETTVSTSADQIALAPGYLQRQWVDHGRRYFHYRMDRPMLPFFCYLSARWKVARDQWQGVPIEIYYDAKHPYNVQRMIHSAKRSFDYFTKNFSPYQFRQLRVLEFPGYARFAQSFANTVPYSEAIGFIADLRKPEDIDYVFYITAHEVAHQWWGHQVIGADMQGQSMLMESLAQYSALMVMEQEYGPARMRKFLKYELDRYLRQRGGELIEELPLMRVENQPYIHYQKGSLVFYRLRDEIGEVALNRALARFIKDKAFQSAPFTTSRELLEYLRVETPPDKRALLDELFAKIIFYDNRVVSANVSKRPDGKYAVDMELSASKLEADGLGKETPRSLDDWVEVAVFARPPGDSSEEHEKLLYLQKHHITGKSVKLTLVVDQKPAQVGFDPYNKLIDRIPDDNRLDVSERRP